MRPEDQQAWRHHWPSLEGDFGETFAGMWSSQQPGTGRPDSLPNNLGRASGKLFASRAGLARACLQSCVSSDVLRSTSSGEELERSRALGSGQRRRRPWASVAKALLAEWLADPFLPPGPLLQAHGWAWKGGRERERQTKPL